MTHSSILTIEEWKKSPIHPEIAKYLIHYTNEINKRPSEIKVLDWGCGRGGDVLHLLDMGYDAYGLDICPITIGRGKEIFKRLGYDFDKRMSLLGSDIKSPYPDGKFDFVFTYQVIEHVDDLDAMVSEHRRVMHPGGSGVHIFPGRFRLIEGHLLMPFVHWLPKNNARKHLIILFTAMGIEPKWQELSGKSCHEKASVYYKYSVNSLFYRSKRKIRETFAKYGYKSADMTLEHDKLKAKIGNMVKLGPLRRIFSIFIPAVTSVVLSVRIPPD